MNRHCTQPVAGDLMYHPRANQHCWRPVVLPNRGGEAASLINRGPCYACENPYQCLMQQVANSLHVKPYHRASLPGISVICIQVV